jgi:hypothetical protein
MANKKIHELPITNNFNDGNLKIPVSDGSTTYSMDVTGYTQSILSGVTISGDYLPLSGGAMTGNIESFEGFALYSDNGVNTLGLYYGTSGSDGIITESSNSGGTFSRITIRDGSIEVLSNDINFSGITYDVDYSPNFTNRSLVDKEYVDSKIKYKEYVFKFTLSPDLEITDFATFYTLNDDGFNPTFLTPTTTAVSFTSPLLQGIDVNTKVSITPVYQDRVGLSPAQPLVGYCYDYGGGIIYVAVETVDYSIPTDGTGVLVSVKVYN